VSVANGPEVSHGSGVPRESAVTVDARNPWLGLASFTEETRGVFNANY